MSDSLSPKVELGLIPARGGSVGLPGKNIKALGDVPLIAWTIRSALRSGCFERVAVSTDDPAIAECARVAGAEVPFVRPAHLASDTASSLGVVQHAIQELGCEQSIGLLQPTSPFRSANHIRQAVARFFEDDLPALISVVDAKPLEWSMRFGTGGILTKVNPADNNPTRRQDASSLVQPNGALYLVRVQAMEDARSFTPPGTVGFRMSKIDSLDIDDADDFALAEAVVVGGLRTVDP